MYEGRTRGKRMRYTFSEGEEEDSETGVRRSTRNSGRESSAAPGGPTVTSSGRHVRSRAAGVYGETLHSGQTTDHPSPATGDYVRSDASEEPERPAHGRATRAAGRGAGVAPLKKRNLESFNEEMSDEEDATSWNGDDEDEDEPDQMELDDDDDERESEEEASEEEPEQLILRLRVKKEYLQSFNSVSNTTNETSHSTPVTTGPPLSGMDAARQQPVLAPVPAPAATAAPPAMPMPPPKSLVEEMAPQASFPPAQEFSDLPSVAPVAQTNGFHPQPVEPVAVPPIAPVATLPAAPAHDAHTLPPLVAPFRAPTPPYTAQEAPKPDLQPAFSVTKPEVPRSPKPFPATSLPVPPPATNWH